MKVQYFDSSLGEYVPIGFAKVAYAKISKSLDSKTVVQAFFLITHEESTAFADFKALRRVLVQFLDESNNVIFTGRILRKVFKKNSMMLECDGPIGMLEDAKFGEFLEGGGYNYLLWNGRVKSNPIVGDPTKIVVEQESAEEGVYESPAWDDDQWINPDLFEGGTGALISGTDDELDEEEAHLTENDDITWNFAPFSYSITSGNYESVDVKNDGDILKISGTLGIKSGWLVFKYSFDTPIPISKNIKKIKIEMRARIESTASFSYNIHDNAEGSNRHRFAVFGSRVGSFRDESFDISIENISDYIHNNGTHYDYFYFSIFFLIGIITSQFQFDLIKCSVYYDDTEYYSPQMHEIADNGSNWIKTNWEAYPKVKALDSVKIGVSTKQICEDIMKESGVQIEYDDNFDKFSVEQFRSSHCIEVLTHIKQLEGAKYFEKSDGTVGIFKPENFEPSGVSLTESDYSHDWEYEDNSNESKEVEVFGNKNLNIYAKKISEVADSSITKSHQIIDDKILDYATAYKIAEEQLALMELARDSIKIVINGINSNLDIGKTVNLTMSRPTIASQDYPIRMIEIEEFAEGVYKTTLYCGLGSTSDDERIAKYIKDTAYETRKLYHDNLLSKEVSLGQAAVTTWSSILNKPTTFTPSAHTHNLADLSERSYNSLTDKPSIPTKLSDLSLDVSPSSLKEIPNNTALKARNAADTANKDLIKLDATDKIVLGDGAGADTIIDGDLYVKENYSIKLLGNNKGLIEKNSGGTERTTIKRNGNILEIGDATENTGIKINEPMDLNSKTITNLPAPTQDTHPATKKYVDDYIKAIYPVGSLYISTISTNPNALLGFGTWTAFGAGKFLVGIDSTDADFDAAEETGGAKTVTLAANNIPELTTKSQSESTTSGQSQTHNHSITSAGTGSTGDSSKYYGRNDFYASRTSGNASNDHTHTLSHTHKVGEETPTAVNKVPPYIVVYMWKRTE